MRYTARILSTLCLLAIGCTPAGAPGQSAATPSPSTSASPTPSPSPTVQTFALSGTVYDENLSPVAGASVTVTSAGTQPPAVTTGSDGRFSVQLPAGSYTVTATKANWTQRQQSVTLSADTSLDFGGPTMNEGNPYFISAVPEIASTTAQEAAPGGPLTLTFNFSEPVTTSSQASFNQRLEIMTGDGSLFVRPNQLDQPYLKATLKWNAAGNACTVVFSTPYLASGPLSGTVNYFAKLQQQQLGTVDPVTLQNQWEQLAITDAAGNELGYNRADYAFVQTTLAAVPPDVLTNKNFGYTPAIARWNFTHQSQFTFKAAQDTSLPGVTSVQVNGTVPVGNSQFDVMDLHFTKPMQVFKSEKDGLYTRLDKKNDLLKVMVSGFKNGQSPKPLAAGASVQDIRFDPNDFSHVYVDFPPGSFSNQQWVQINLDAGMQDPAGNGPDPAKSQATGNVSAVTTS